MKIYPYQTPNGVIDLVEKREYYKLFDNLCEAEELIREIRDGEVNAQDEADKFFRDHQPSELSLAKAEIRKHISANAELIERLAEARESHIHASARDVQTIQRQSVLLERLANALKSLQTAFDCEAESGLVDHDQIADIIQPALSAYESANLELVNPIDEAVRRMEAVSDEELNEVHWNGDGCVNSYAANNRVRARLISAAKGES